MSSPLDKIEDEARRVVASAQQEGVTLRLLGGLAVRLHSPSATHRSLARAYPDLDFATPHKRAQPVEKLFADLGYTPNKTFNLLNGDVRLLFNDETHQRQVDIFVAQFSMCHKIPITERISLEPLTLPLAELLLTKLQVVEMNEKDVRDVCALLLDHPLGQADDEMINLNRVAQLTSDDWGLWKTCTISLVKVQRYLDTVQIELQSRDTIHSRIKQLEAAFDASPKTMRWRMRDRVGERVKWYDLPEEVKRG